MIITTIVINTTVVRNSPFDKEGIGMEEIEKIHKMCLMIAKEIKRICENNNIKFFLIAGSCLGAVRHKGFIPWDDDMDIGMLREDYEKFIKCCEIDLDKEKFFWQSCYTDKNYGQSIGKVRLNDTICKLEHDKTCKYHHGVYVDVFPFDSVPEKNLSRKNQKFKYWFYKEAMWMKKGMKKNVKNKKPIRYFAFWIAICLIPYKLLKHNFLKTKLKYNKYITTQVVTDGGYGYNKESLLRKWFDESVNVLFEGEMFPIFKEYDDYLKHLYGDYMILPPKDKRKTHMPVELDFGPYEKEFE